MVYPSDSSTFDIILLKSVFTHIMPNKVDNYMKEISRMMKPSGKCLATLFLLKSTATDARKQAESISKKPRTRTITLMLTSIAQNAQ